MKGSKGRSPWLWVRSWTMSQSTKACWQRSWSPIISRMSSGSSRPRMSYGLTRHRTEAGGLAVAEDAAPGEALGSLAHGDGLGEEHRGVGVVARGEVLEGDAAEQGVVVARALQLGEPLGPHHAQRDGLEVAVRVAVLRVHGEDDEVLESVGAAAQRAGRPAASPGSPGTAKPLGGPLAQIGDQRAVVLGIVRQQRGELLHGVQHRVQCRLDGHTAGRALGVEVDRTVLGLPGPDLLNGILEPRPCRVVHHPVTGGYGAHCGRPAQEFPSCHFLHGRTCVKTPYLCPVLPYK